MADKILSNPDLNKSSANGANGKPEHIEDRLFINGEFVPSIAGKKFDIESPYSEQKFASVYEALPEDVDKAVAAAEAEGADAETLLDLLGHGRAKSGMFEGNMVNGELEIGQVAAMLNEIKPAADILWQIWSEFLIEKERLSKSWNI